MPPVAKVSEIQQLLLSWYSRHRRPLPWRSTKDPYAIWVAETMLQQTQVATVLPYYRRFLKAFPTLPELHRASKSRVLAHWSGLGYYRRAENLKKAAGILVRRHGGDIPRDYKALCALPGIGAYTAGALMSIAFNRAYPAVDGNARRVLSRVFNLNREHDLLETAGRLVPPSRPGDFNQALMELGSGICVPRDPGCPDCPLASPCRARASGSIPPPVRPKRRRPIQVQWPLAIIERRGRVLLRRRRQGGLLAGLWEIPGGLKMEKERIEATLARHLSPVKGLLAGTAKKRVGEVRHSITYRRIRASVFVFCGDRDIRLPDSSWRWVSAGFLNQYPLSSLSLKAVQLFMNGGAPSSPRRPSARS